MPARAKGDHMSDTDTTTTTEPTTEPQEPHGTETDWKAEARKWEKRAKENSEAAAELAKLKAASMSDAEKMEARATAAEQELAQLKAEREFETAVREVAAKSGVAESILRHCADRDAMEALAAELASQPTRVAPTGAASRLVVSQPSTKTNAEAFAEIVDQLFTS